MNRFIAPALILLVATSIAGWYLFRPERLFIDTIVAESLEDAAGRVSFDAAEMPIALAQGGFRGVHHPGTGVATVYRLADSRRILRFSDFATDNGPDLFVYLVAARDAPDNESVERAGFVSLGRLKGNKGEQNYEIPAQIDLSQYRAVSIWCRRFGVNFAYASLTTVMPDDQTL